MDSDATTTPQPPNTARQLQIPAALALADLVAIFEDLKVVLGSCEQMIAEINDGEGKNTLGIEGLWTNVLLAWHRCFIPGPRGMGLTEQDLTDTGLEGEVVQWHAMLGQIRELFVDSEANPRESFTVGATQDADGAANGVAIMSSMRPQMDERTVRQTGQIAYALSQLVDGRIKTQQEKVLNSAQAMTTDALNALPLVELSGFESEEPPAG
ncbi:MAG: hypothetical protein ACRDQ5_11905 [Sciscionella sp.]